MNDERAKLLMTRPGIDYFSAMLLVAEIGDINRFLSKHKLASWAGLVPSVRQSGHTIHYGHITTQGNKYVRWVLIQCANVAVRHDEVFINELIYSLNTNTITEIYKQYLQLSFSVDLLIIVSFVPNSFQLNKTFKSLLGLQKTLV